MDLALRVLLAVIGGVDAYLGYRLWQSIDGNVVDRMRQDVAGFAFDMRVLLVTQLVLIVAWAVFLAGGYYNNHTLIDIGFWGAGLFFASLGWVLHRWEVRLSP